MDEVNKPKLEIEKEFQEKLKLYFVIFRPPQYQPIQGEKVQAIMAYRVEDMMERVKELVKSPAVNPFGNNIFIFNGDYLLVEEILNDVKAREGLKELTSIKVEPAPESKQQFIWNLQLATDKYIENGWDKETVKKIIEKIK